MERPVNAFIFLATPWQAAGGFINETGYYILGTAIAVIVFAYLVYALLKPEKF